MLEIKEKNDKTLSDAAKHLGVSPKTVRGWIKKRIIPEPPKKNYGIRKIDIFTEKYLEQASKLVDEYRNAQDELVNKIERFNNAKLQKERMKETSEKELLQGYQSLPKEEIHFRLKNIAQMSSFIHTLFANRIPHSSYCGNIITTSLKDKLAFEEKGFELEVVKLTNLSELSLEERNDIKKRSRAHWLATRDSAIDEFLSKYGSE